MRRVMGEVVVAVVASLVVGAGCDGRSVGADNHEASDEDAGVQDAVEDAVEETVGDSIEDSVEGGSACELGSVTMFAGATFYEERSETELISTGALEEREVDPSPSGRDFVFWLQDLPVYSGGVEARIRPFVGLLVSVRGKIVDVGYGDALWPATIECAALSGDGGR